MTAPPTLTVQGVEVPRVGFGTWQITGREAYDSVLDALEAGYRHIDTARIYENESEVGRALADSPVARDDVFLTTKIWPDDFEPDRLKAAAEASLRRLGVDHVDLLLLHWPNPDVRLEDTIEALEDVHARGLTRLIGVSNFPPELLRRAAELAPVANDQVPYHPYERQDPLVEVADELDVFVTAYSPLAQGKVGQDPVLREIGEAHGKTPGQVALRWLLEHDRVAVIPKSASAERRRENLEVLDFDLTPEERGRIG
jgi:diketogulonate reductase-like aldo/keto reductase